jgi:hypothetical protein
VEISATPQPSSTATAEVVTPAERFIYRLSVASRSFRGSIHHGIPRSERLDRFSRGRRLLL